ncbi:hypothetical protein NBRC110019_13740 [Neptunitalea chrysea]|uniref:Type IX secretion system membrane protein PorP/SprF n=2 Tax=Neptunitalea chrysea TaxID=1647581 RepID=A0A9W6B6U9_9FLAO|nr:hypothetical protein NBRC110019_13740 [Neptunitalea chrysea]
MVPQTLNPGATALQESSSVGLLHRYQWPNSKIPINSDYAFYNTFSEAMNSGIGVNVLSQIESFSHYRLLQVNLAYSYRVQLSRNWYFHPGLEVGYGTKNYGFQNHVLGDQFNIDTGTINDFSIDPLLLNENVGYFDISAGAIINNEQFWFGLSVKHLNRPQISFTNYGNTYLDMFFSVMASYTFEFQDQPRFIPYDTKLLLSANFMQQGEYNRLDLGMGLRFDPVYAGLVLATNPNSNTENAPIVTSLNPYLGFEYDHFKVGYSYDVIVNGMGQSGGIHELSLIYMFNLTKDCDGCPDYYKGPKTKTYLY